MYNFSVARLLVLPREEFISRLHSGMNRSDLVEYSLTKTVLLSDIISAHRQNLSWSNPPFLYCVVPSYGGSQYITLFSGISISVYGSEDRVNDGISRRELTVLLKLLISAFW